MLNAPAGIFNSALPSLASGQQQQLQLDSSGRLIVAAGSGGAISVTAATTDRNRFQPIVATGSTLTRPANTTAYTSGDSVSDNATAGSVVAQTVTLSDTNDDPVTIERVRLATADTGPATAGAIFEMYLFASDPTANSGVGNGDNSAYSQKQAGFIGRMIGQFIGGTSSFSDGSVAVLVPAEGSRIVTKPATGAKTIYWQIKTDTAFTPSASSSTFTPTFEGVQGRA